MHWHSPEGLKNVTYMMIYLERTWEHMGVWQKYINARCHVFIKHLKKVTMFKWSFLPIQPSENSSHEAKCLMNKHDPPLFHMFFLPDHFWLFEISCCNLPTTCILCLLYCIVLLQEVTKCCSIHTGSIYIVHSYCVACTYSKYPVLNYASDLSIRPQFASGSPFFALRFSVIMFIFRSLSRTETLSSSFTTDYKHYYALINLSTCYSTKISNFSSLHL